MKQTNQSETKKIDAKADATVRCAICDREVFGFWKQHVRLEPVCSKKCLRALIHYVSANHS